MIKEHLSETELQEAAESLELITPSRKEHLLGCANCQLQVENYKLILNGIKTLSSPSFHFDLAADVMANLPVRKAPFHWVPVAASAIGVLLAGMVILLFGSRVGALFQVASSSLVYLLIIPALVLLVLQLIFTYSQYQRKMDFFENT